jgi:cytochrome c553
MIERRWLLSLILLGMFSGCGESESKPQEHESVAGSAAIKVTEGAVDTHVKKGNSKENSGKFYYSYNKEKNASGYNAEDSKTRTTIDAYLNIKSPYEKVKITMMIKQLSREYVIKCAPCHDDYANGIIGPSLLDKNATFIYNRITDFKTGKRKNVLMKELVEQIEDEKLHTIADEIARFNAEIRKMRRGK